MNLALTRGKGILNPNNLADSIYVWPLKGHVHMTSFNFSGFWNPSFPLVSTKFT